MRSTVLSQGLDVEYDERLFTISSPTPRPENRRGRGSFGGGPTPLNVPQDGGTASLFANILVRRDVAKKATPTIAFVATSDATAISRASPEPPRPSRIRVALADDEQAVVLVERDGLLAWRFPNGGDAPATGPMRGTRSASGQRIVAFDIEPFEIVAAPADPKRGWLSDRLIAGAKAVVLYFAADYAAGKIVDLLERGSRDGPVVITSEADVSRWLRPDDFSQVALPADAARVLLLVHGTFSTTAGGFGGLTATPWGRKLLRTALDRYDAVIGFDHRTLSVAPDDNAKAIVAALGSLSSKTVVVDAICHSRGGLVLRTLIESLLPQSGLPIGIERAIFVAATNNGTELARPANWESLIDLMTNLAAVTGKALSLFPASAAVAMVTEEVVSCIGDFVKYLVTVAVTDRKVPGIAAMEPDGAFVAQLNRTQAGQPTPGTLECYAVVSNFRARIGESADHEPKEFSRRLAMMLTDGVVDRLMRGDGADDVANDLVVNVASMTDIDRAVPGFVRDVMDFGTNHAVYHTNYFLRPETVGHLALWLKLPSPLHGIDPLALSGVERDFVSVDADQSVGALRSLLSQQATRLCVVARRDPRPDCWGDLHYAFMRGEIEDRIRDASETATLADALDLHEIDVSPAVGITANGISHDLRSALRGTATAGRGVVLSPSGDPAGVVHAGIARMGTTELAVLALARQALPPGAEAGPSPRTASGRPATQPKRSGAAKPGAVTGAPQASTEMYVMTEMPREVAIHDRTTLSVTLSIEALQATAGMSGNQGRAGFDPDRKIVVDVVPRSGFDYLPDDATRGRVEADPPTPKRPVVLDFDLIANEVGTGEVNVTIRQGALRRLRLSVRADVVSNRADRVVPLVSDGAVVVAQDPLDRCASLVVYDRRNEGKLQLEFILDADGAYDRFTSAQILVDPATYAEQTYEAIESAWTDSGRAIDRFESNLAGWGGEMFEGLFPHALQRSLWALAKEDRLSGIQIVSTEPFIPWEIVYLSDPDKPGSDGRFFAEFGLCRWLYGATPTRTIDVRSEFARYVVPHYPDSAWRLANAEDVEEPYLRDTLHATPVEPMVREVLDLLKRQPGCVDLLHFACHGEAEVGKINSSALLMQGEVVGSGAQAAWVKEPLQASTVRKFAALLGPHGERPMVVVNACQTGRIGYSFTGIGGFAPAFLGTREGTGDSRGRAGAFVGALWQVGDEPAATFVIALYEHLRAGKAMAEASRLARSDARAKGEATWLAYSVYAHSQLKVRFDGVQRAGLAS